MGAHDDSKKKEISRSLGSTVSNWTSPADENLFLFVDFVQRDYVTTDVHARH